MLALAAHILKLAWYREDLHDPCTRMTGKFVKYSMILESQEKANNQVKETVWDQIMEIEAVKKIQIEGILRLENLGKQVNTGLP